MRTRYTAVLLIFSLAFIIVSCMTPTTAQTPLTASPFLPGTPTLLPSMTPMMDAHLVSDFAFTATSMAFAFEATSPPTMAAATQPAMQGQGQNQPAQPQKRVVLKNASFTIIVKDVPTTLNSLGTMAEEFGGWIVTSTTNQRPGRYYDKLIYGTITVRVPAERFTATLDRIRNAAVSVENEDIRGDDVSQQYADLSSRLTNLEAAERQLRTIMDNADTTDAVLNVYRELVRVRGEIEQIKGQLQYFDQAAAFSSITINLLPHEEPPPVTPTPTPTPTPYAGWQPSNAVNQGVGILTNFVQGVIDALILFTIAVLPVLLPIALIGWVVFRRVRRVRRNRQSKPAQTTAESAPVEDSQL